MNKKLAILGTVFLCLLLSFYTKAIRVEATDQTSVGFTIEAILPENQIDKNNSFFDLRMEPNKKQVIKVKIKNTTINSSSYTIRVNQAYTNNQGFIDYSNSEESKKNKLPYKIDDIIKYKKELTLDGNEQKEVSFEIDMPKEPFDGKILAGIQVIKKNNKEKEQNQISNSVGYILGLQLTETDNKVQRKLDLLSVKPEAKFGHPTVVATIENPTMEALGHLKYEAKIVTKNGRKEIYKKTYDNNMELAPNSYYDFAIEFINQRITNGEYVLILNIKDAKKNSWDFEKEFTVTSKEAESINRVTIDANDTQTKIPYRVIIIGLTIMIIIVCLYVYLSKKEK